MTLQQFIKNEEGYTIQELLVVLLVGSLLVSFSFSLFLFTNKLVYSWQKKTEMKSVVSGILQSVALDILHSRCITEVTDTSLVLEKNAGVLTAYRFNGLQVWRGDIPLSSVKEAKITLKISNVSSTLLRLKVMAQLKNYAVENETQVSIPRSGTNEFAESSIGLH